MKDVLDSVTSDDELKATLSYIFGDYGNVFAGEIHFLLDLFWKKILFLVCILLERERDANLIASTPNASNTCTCI